MAHGMNSHTPGPWRVVFKGGGWSIKSAKPSALRSTSKAQQTIAQANWLLTQGRWSETEADANLLAAAPDLLDALRAYMFPAGDTAEELFAQGKAAVAKAEARTH